MQHTNQYQFNLIESGDTFSPQPLNENAEKMEQALAELESAIPQVVMGTYLGNGTLGFGDNATKVTLGCNPRFVIIWGGSNHFGLFSRIGGSQLIAGASSCDARPVWGDGTLSFYCSFADAAYQLNTKGAAYSWIAIC